MQLRVWRAVALVAAVAGRALANEDRSVAAVQKVIQMLTDMASKGKQDKAAEEVGFASFSTWCQLQQVNLAAAVQKGEQEVETLTAEIGKLGADVTALGDEISGLQRDVAKYTSDMQAQKDQREKDHTAFLAEQKDYAESVDALDRAINILQKQNFDRTALLQVSELQRLPVTAQTMVSAFLGMLNDDSDDPSAYKAPEANAYEFQSGGIIDMLKKLKDEFTEKKGQCEKEEMNSQHAHDMLVQDLTGSAEVANRDISEKSGLKLEKEGTSASLTKQLASTKEVKAEDEKTLSDTNVECREKSASFAEKQQLRAEEIEAIEKAIEILKSQAVSGAAEAHLSLAAMRKASAFVQVLRGTSSADAAGIRVRLRNFLESEGARLHSKGLALLAQKLEADPFTKVKKMIQDMITRLLEEAHGDATHEGFCDKELGQNEITRSKLSQEIDALTASVEGGKAMITQLTQEVTVLTQEMADLDVAVQQATAMRTDEKAKNLATIKDAQAAQQAVEAATAVLKDFYAKAGTATGLLQVSASERQIPTTAWGKEGRIKMGSQAWHALANPDFKGKVDLGHQEGQQTFGATYQGQQDSAGGVLAMLEVILSDFASLKADTESSESLAQQEYNKYMAEAKKEKAVKSQKVELDEADRVSAEGKLRDDTADLKFTQDKLLAAERYYEELKPQCLDQGMTFEDRAKARQEEIQSLKEALRILSGEDIA